MRRLTASSVVVVVPSPPGRRSTAARRGSSRSRRSSRPRRPPGPVESTIPSWLGSVTRVEDDRDGQPGALQDRRRVGLALARSRPAPASSPGPSRPRASPSSPSRRCCPRGGSEATTTPCAWSDWMSTRDDGEALALRAPTCAFANGSPVTSGTGTGFAPRETLMRTFVPFGTPVAGVRLLRGDGVGLAAVEKTRTMFGSRPSCASDATAWLTSWPTTLGTCDLRDARSRRSERHRRALADLRAAGRVLLGDLARGHGLARGLEDARRQTRPPGSSPPRAAARAAARRARRPACSGSADPGSSGRGTSRRSPPAMISPSASSHGQIERPRGGSS